MKTHITIIFAIIALFAAVSCSSPFEGTWETKDTLTENGIKGAEISQYFTFTPSGKKAGSVITGVKGQLFLEELGSIDFSMSVPGTYSFKNDMIIISNDLDAIKSDAALNASVSLGPDDLESGEYKDLEEFIRNIKKELDTDLAPNACDTLKQVVINDNTLTVNRKSGSFVYTKAN